MNRALFSPPPGLPSPFTGNRCPGMPHPEVTLNGNSRPYNFNSQVCNEMHMQSCTKPNKPKQNYPGDQAALKALHPDGLTPRNIWQLSRFKDATKEVQKRLSTCTNQEFTELVQGLRGHFCEASKDPNANHVMQVVIEHSFQEVAEWIFEEIRDAGVINVAQHRYQCRIVQRMLEHFPPTLVEEIGSYILSDLAEVQNLCTHNFGNYVMSCLLERARNHHQRYLMNFLISCCASIGRENNGAAVLGAALSIDNVEDLKENLASAILACEALVSEFMALSRHGSSTVKLAIRVIQIKCPDKAMQHLLWLKDSEGRLRANRYGRALVAFAKEELNKIKH